MPHFSNVRHKIIHVTLFRGHVAKSITLLYFYAVTTDALLSRTTSLADVALAWKPDASRNEKPSAQAMPRLFSTWEITRYMIPVATAHLRRVLRNRPDLPQGRIGIEKSARWFSFEDVCVLRQHFSREGAAHKGYLPYRPDHLPAQIVCLAHIARGTGKTTLAAHLAVAAALDGYRVLALDLDSQGDLTKILGGEVGQTTAATLMARHHGEHLQLENRLRVSRGETPVPLEDTLSEALAIDKIEMITRSRWSGLDLIASGPLLAVADIQAARWRLGTRSWRPWEWLGWEQNEGELFDDYDLIVIDTPPSLGVLSISGIAASDLLLVPTVADVDAIDITSAFFRLLHQSFSEIEAQENVTAKALGSASLEFSWNAVRTVMTQYDAAYQGETAAHIQSGPGRNLLAARQDLTPLIGTGKGRARCIYDVDYRDFTREAYVAARRGFDETYDELKRIFTGNWQRAAEAME